MYLGSAVTGGVVVEYRTQNREVMISLSTGSTVLCPSARHINSTQYWLIHKKRWLRADKTEKLLTETLTNDTINYVFRFVTIAIIVRQ